MQTKACKPADRDVDLRLAQQLPIMDGAEQKARQHKADRDLRIDAGAPCAGGLPGSAKPFLDLAGMLEVLGPVMMFSAMNRASSSRGRFRVVPTSWSMARARAAASWLAASARTAASAASGCS
jgi:hypothetical protein